MNLGSNLRVPLQAFVAGLKGRGRGDFKGWKIWRKMEKSFKFFKRVVF